MVQSLLITEQPWFKDYRMACVNNLALQDSWVPAIGDWMERHYHLDLSPVIVKDEYVVEMICYRSSAEGYWHVTGADGQTRVWNSNKEIVKKTARWIPRLDQLLADVDNVLDGTVQQIHHSALDNYINRLRTKNYMAIT